MGYWDTPPMDRTQFVLFSPTLDAVIPEDHSVRLFDEILGEQDWSAWEAHYHGKRGRPPIPPRVLAGVILYGLSLGIRSSRKLERASTVSLDFLWLTHGRSIDHTTISQFRRKFSKELKDLFQQIGLLAMSIGLVRLNVIGLDGTREAANSSRHATASAATLADREAALEEQIQRLLAEAEQTDRREEGLFGPTSADSLPRELSTLEKRKEALAKARAAAEQIDARRSQRSDKPKKAAKVPVADPDAAVLPNKEGGYAPNYTPMSAVDGHRGFVVDAEVHNEANESQETVATVDRVEETFGQKPEEILADSNHATGQNLAELEEREVTSYMPVEGGSPADNPALREDPSEPVPETEWDRLPRTSKGKLDKAAFVYDALSDCYHCPLGRKLEYKGTMRQGRKNGEVHYRRYECASCEGCPLAGDCLTSGRARTVNRDEYEQCRERIRARMESEEGKRKYARRKWICETVFGYIKSCMGMRRFLLRGLENVKTEWLWACTAFNLGKLVREVARMRVKFAALLA